nr:putative ribonuclease H-like domain-containing protein [Tanacetum cinerariifolium]
EEIDQQNVLFPVWSFGFKNPHNNDEDAAFDGKEPDFDAKKPESEVNVSPSSSAQSRKQDDKTKKEAKRKSHVESFTRYRDLSAEFEDCSNNSINKVNVAGTIVATVEQNSLNSTNAFSAAELKDITYSDDEYDVGAEADFNNLKTSITKVWILVDFPHGKRAIGTKWVFRNKKDERGIVVRNKARLVTQGHTQEEGSDYEEVFAPIARIEVIRLFLAYASFMGFMVYQMDVKSTFLYETIEEEVYACQPPGFEDPDHPDKVYKVVKALYGLHQALRACKAKERWIFISQDKYVAEILRKFRLTEGKSACTPIDTEKPLLKDPDGEDVDVHTYRLQALVDRKKVVVTEAIIREALRLDDAEGVDCLPNKEIFAELARMGYEKPSTKLTFYKAFFLSQWKFLIHKILLCMSAKRTSWNEFSSSMASVVICLSPGDLSTHTTKYTSPALIQKVFANIKRVGKGFSGVETPLFEGMLVEQQGDNKGDVDEHVEEVNTGDAAEGDDSDAHREVLTVAEEKSIPSPTPPTPPPQPPQDIPSTSQVQQTPPQSLSAQALEITKLKRMVKKLEKKNKWRMIAEMDQDDAVVLEDDKEEDKDVVDDVKDVEKAKVDEDETEPTKVQEVVDIVTTTKLIIKVVIAASETVTATSTIITTVEAQVPTATLTAAPVRVAAAPSRRRKGVVIRDPEEESNTSTIIPTETKSKDKVINHVKLKAKEDPAVKKYQAMKKKPQTEAQARKNMMMYLKNTKEYIEEDENRALQKINETPAERAAKRRILDEEVEDLKRHLQIVPNEDDDVYNKATPLARKVPVVDYEIIEMNNKPYCKIIRADADFVSGKEVPTLKIYSRPDAECWLFSPPKLDLSNSSLEEFQQPEFEGYGPKNSKSVSKDISNEVKESPDASLVKELVSDDKPREVNTVRPNSAIVNAVMANKINAVKDSTYMLPLGEEPKEGKLLLKELLKLMYDKKNSVLFTDTGCFVLSSDFKLTDESQILLKVPRKNNMYSVDMKNIVPKESLTCLVFFSATKDETSGILKSFISKIENLVNKKIKIIKYDNGTEFKNKVMSDFCKKKGIKKEFSVARTPQQNGVAKRRNRTLIEAAKIMLTDFKLPTTFWAKAVNTACYMQNRESFDGKSNDRFFIGYSLNSKAFRVYNIRTRKVEKNLHIRFLENKPIIASDGPKWLFDIDALTKSTNYVPFVADGSLFDSSSKNANNDEPQPFSDVGKKDDDGVTKESGINDQERPENSIQDINIDGPCINTFSINVNTNSININIVSPLVTTAPLEATHADLFGDETEVDMSNISSTYLVPSTPNTRIHKDHSLDHVIGDVQSGVQTRRMTKTTNKQGFITTVYEGKTQEDLHTYLFACFLYLEEPKKMDVKSAFLYGKIEEEVYVYQPLGFEDPEFPDRVYKVEKTLYGLHQALRAWYETLSTYLLDNGFHKVETPMNMSPENKTHFLAEKEAIHLILTEIGDEIYSTINACQTAQEMWEAIERLQQVNELRAERIARNANPLALVTTAQANQDPYYQTSKSYKSHAPSSKPSIPTRSHTTTTHKGKEIAKPITPPSETAFEKDSDPEQA